jgi:hypothetical protein
MRVGDSPAPAPNPTPNPDPNQPLPPSNPPGGAIAIGSLHAVTHLRSGEGHITIKTGADGDLAIHTAHGDVNVQLVSRI